MNKVIKYIFAYAMWIAALSIAFWLIHISRTAFLNILVLFNTQGTMRYLNALIFADQVFVIVMGLGWLVFLIFSEEYFRIGVLEEVLLNRIIRVTGPLFLGVFSVDLILFWLNVGSQSWLRWLILAVELGGGIVLLVSPKLIFGQRIKTRQR